MNRKNTQIHSLGDWMNVCDEKINRLRIFPLRMRHSVNDSVSFSFSIFVFRFFLFFSFHKTVAVARTTYMCRKCGTYGWDAWCMLCMPVARTWMVVTLYRVLCTLIASKMIVYAIISWAWFFSVLRVLQTHLYQTYFVVVVVVVLSALGPCIIHTLICMLYYVVCGNNKTNNNHNIWRCRWYMWTRETDRQTEMMG